MELRRRILNIERREKKTSIVIKEVDRERGNAKEIVSKIVRELAGEELVKEIKEVYSIGKEKDKVILVKMSEYENKSKVMANRNKLKGTQIYLDDDLSKEEREVQRHVRIWADEERKKGRSVKIGRGKCSIGEDVYVWNEAEKQMVKRFREIRK